MHGHRVGSIVLLTILIFVSRGWGGDAAAPRSEAPRQAPGQAQPAANATNAFAIDLYHQLRAEDGNLLVSPYSIATALAMTGGGAAGQTQQQIETVLHWQVKLNARPDGPPRVSPPPAVSHRLVNHPDMAALMQQLNRAGGDKAFDLNIANGLWLQRGYAIKAPFKKLVTETYSGKLAQLDFAQSQQAAGTINDAIARQTRGKIEDLIPPSALTADTRLVLTNAVYMKGRWVHPFSERATSDAPWGGAGPERPQVPLMRQTERFFYGQNNQAQWVQMDYTNAPVAMLVVLPRPDVGLAKLEQTLSADLLEAWVKAMNGRKVELYLPRFEFTDPTALNKPLAALGIEDAFEPGRSDFSSITDAEDLYIQSALHKAFIAVDEEGTEAAAATAIAVGATSVDTSRPVVFRADRPFLFFIRDTRSGVLLFMGRMIQPAAADAG